MVYFGHDLQDHRFILLLDETSDNAGYNKGYVMISLPFTLDTLLFGELYTLHVPKDIVQRIFVKRVLSPQETLIIIYRFIYRFIKDSYFNAPLNYDAQRT